MAEDSVFWGRGALKLEAVSLGSSILLRLSEDVDKWFSSALTSSLNVFLREAFFFIIGSILII